MPLIVANAPCSWGVDYAGAPDNPAPEAVFAGIASAGYRFAELGPYGYAPTDPSALTAMLTSHRLHLVGGFLFEPFHDPDAHTAITEKAHRLIPLIAAAGGTVLNIIDHISPGRERTAGQPQRAERLDEARFQAMVRLVAELARPARDAGVTLAIHHHAASFIEFNDEIDRVLSAVPPGDAGLCLDTGHAAFCGLDPVDLARRHADRLCHVHLKDIDATVRDIALAEGCGFDETVARGVFLPLGQGVVDLVGFAQAIEAMRYRGFATVEQDMAPDRSAPQVPIAAAKESLSRLLTAHPAYQAERSHERVVRGAP